MRRCLSVAFVVSAVGVQFAGADPQTERIRQFAAESTAALTAGNYGRVVELTYPKLVEVIGGRDRMIEMLRSGQEDMKAQGSVTLSAEVSEPKEVVTVSDKRFAIVPEIVRIHVPEGIFRSNGFLIAISENRGNTWTFIDGAGLHKAPGEEREMLVQIVPSFPAKLALPAWQPPVLEPK